MNNVLFVETDWGDWELMRGCWGRWGGGGGGWGGGGGEIGGVGGVDVLEVLMRGNNWRGLSRYENQGVVCTVCTI